MKCRWSYIAALVVTSVFVMAAMLFVDRVSPRALTLTRMSVIKNRILLYARQNHSLPPSLFVLPILEDKDNKIEDGWGRPLGYAVDDDGVVVLSSLGSDGKMGGTGDAADIIERFPSKQKDGRWSDELVR